MRVRTIEQAFEHFQKEDPGTALTKSALRRMVVNGQVPSTRIGQKYLLDIDLLEATLFHPAPVPVAAGKIRPVTLDRRSAV